MKLSLQMKHLRVLYTEIITQFNQGKDFQVDTFINELETETASLVSDILMDDERHALHDWERMEIYVKGKDSGVSQIVSETILNLRRFLISLKLRILLIRQLKTDLTKIEVYLRQ